MSEVQGEFPKVCDLCEKPIGTRIDLDWHGLGNCVPICERCNGSGIEPQASQPAQPTLRYTLDQLNLMLDTRGRDEFQRGQQAMDEKAGQAIDSAIVHFENYDGEYSFTCERIVEILSKFRSLAGAATTTSTQGEPQVRARVFYNVWAKHVPQAERNVFYDSLVQFASPVAPPREEVRALVTKLVKVMPHGVYDKACRMAYPQAQEMQIGEPGLCYCCRLEAALAATNTAQHSPTQPDDSLVPTKDGFRKNSMQCNARFTDLSGEPCDCDLTNGHAGGHSRWVKHTESAATPTLRVQPRWECTCKGRNNKAWQADDDCPIHGVEEQKRRDAVRVQPGREE